MKQYRKLHNSQSYSSGGKKTQEFPDSTVYESKNGLNQQRSNEISQLNRVSLPYRQRSD